MDSVVTIPNLAQYGGHWRNRTKIKDKKQEQKYKEQKNKEK